VARFFRVSHNRGARQDFYRGAWRESRALCSSRAIHLRQLARSTRHLIVVNCAKRSYVSAILSSNRFPFACVDSSACSRTSSASFNQCCAYLDGACTVGSLAAPTFGANTCETGVVLGSRSTVVASAPSLSLLNSICGTVFATLTADNCSATLVGAVPTGTPQLDARPSKKPKLRLAPINRLRLAKNKTIAGIDRYGRGAGSTHART